MPSRNTLRKIRQHHLRNKVSGTPQKPRLNVYKSLNHIYAQIIDDTQGVTLVAASDKDIKDKAVKPLAKGEMVGHSLAKAALAKKIKAVVFDRGGYKYHGVVRALAEGARQEGLQF